MSIEKIPTITTLLRASRCHDEEILQMVLERIIKNGINEEDLNATDCNGRVSAILKSISVLLFFFCVGEIIYYLLPQ